MERKIEISLKRLLIGLVAISLAAGGFMIFRGVKATQRADLEEAMVKVAQEVALKEKVGIEAISEVKDIYMLRVDKEGNKITALYINGLVLYIR